MKFAPRTPYLRAVFFLAGAGEGVEVFDDFAPPEAGFGKPREIACRLQSTRDSADPEVDVVERGGGQLGFDDDVGELHPSAGAHDAIELGEDLLLVGA